MVLPHNSLQFAPPSAQAPLCTLPPTPPPSAPAFVASRL